MRFRSSRPRRHDGPSRRRGVILLVELLFVLPVLLFFLLGIVQFYLLVSAREELLAASRLAARVAAAGDRDRRPEVEDEVRRTVKRALGNGRLATAGVKVTWAEDLSPKAVEGEADWVQVSLDIPARRVAPDLMGWIGFAMRSHRLVVATTTKQET